MSERYRVIVMGSGFGSRGHVRIVQEHPSFVLAGLVGTTRNSPARESARQIGVPYYPGLKAMIMEKGSDTVDLVIVATPPYQHFDNVMNVLHHGMSVLAEKPLAANALEAAKMVMAAHATERRGWVNFEFRMLAARRKLAQMMSSSSPKGRWVSFYWLLGGSGYGAYMNRAVSWNTDGTLGGGYLGAIGSHFIDYLITLFGRVATVQALKVVDVPERRDGINRADDGFSVIFTFESGVSGVLHYRSASRKAMESVLEVTGSEGGYRLVNDQNLYAFDSSGILSLLETEDDTLPPVPAGMDASLQCTWRLYTLIARALTGTGGGEVPTLEDGLLVQRVMDAIDRSHLMGLRCNV